MRVIETGLPGVLVVEPTLFADTRGFFFELFNCERFAALGLPQSFAQDNHSRSVATVVRGLHYQLHRPQGKLVNVVRGAIFDVAVDIRVGSPTFGKWFGTELNGENPRALWIPPGFAHGFCCLTDVADVTYKCTDVYVPGDDRGIHWSDPTIAIDWPVSDPIVSEKDRELPRLDAIGADLPRYRVT